MREYVYLLNNRSDQYLIASGIEVEDLFKITSNKNYILLLHESENASYDKKSKFDYILENNVSKLLLEDIYSFGDFCCIDFGGSNFPDLSKEDISEILFFKHMISPYDEVKIKPLNNDYLIFMHDNGWYLRLYYSSWDSIKSLIDRINDKFHCRINMDLLALGDVAFWIEDNKFEEEEKTENVDKILQKRKVNLR